MNRDEVSKAYTSAKQLRLIYAAYRTSSQAHMYSMARAIKSLRRSSPGGGPEATALAAAIKQYGFAMEVDAVMTSRSEQIRIRLLELRNWQP